MVQPIQSNRISDQPIGSQHASCCDKIQQKVASIVKPIFQAISDLFHHFANAVRTFFISANAEFVALRTKIPGFERESYLDGNCDNFLRKEILKPFMDQVRQFFKVVQESKIQLLQESSFRTTLIELQTLINEGPKGSQITGNRTYYKRLIELFRQVQIDMGSYPDQTAPEFLAVRADVDLFIQDFMMKAEIYQEGIEFLRKRGISSEVPLVDKLTEIPAFLQKGYDELIKNKSDGVFPGLYDPYHLGNLPYTNYSLHLSSGKEIPVIRCPNPASDRLDGENKIAPLGEQYKLFMEAYQRAGKKHFYVNMMRRKMEGVNETPRTESVESLEKLYPGTAQVITIDRNSEFYFKPCGYDRNYSAEKFKKKLHEHLFGERYYWSSELDLKKWKVEVAQIIDHVHTKYFAQKERTRLTERKAMIEIVYCEIIDALIQKFDPDSTNFSCKSCMDRGELTQAEMYLYYLLQSGEKVDQEQLEYLQHVTYFPALMIGNRRMQGKCFERLVPMAQVLCEYYEKQKKHPRGELKGVQKVIMNKNKEKKHATS